MHRLNLPALAVASLLLFVLPQPSFSSAPATDACPAQPLSAADVHTDMQSLRSQLSAARESVAELQSTVAALIGDLRQTHEFSVSVPTPPHAAAALPAHKLLPCLCCRCALSQHPVTTLTGARVA